MKPPFTVNNKRRQEQGSDDEEEAREKSLAIQRKKDRNTAYFSAEDLN